MRVRFLNSGAYLQILINQDDGQDLVEYALIIALIGFAAVFGLRSVVTGVGSVFSAVGAILNPQPGQ